LNLSASKKSKVLPNTLLSKITEEKEEYKEKTSGAPSHFDEPI